MSLSSAAITAFDPETRFILNRFPLNMDERIEIESIRSLLRMASFRTPFVAAPQDSYRDMVASAQFRLNMLQVHEKLYFEDAPPKDRNAMVAAILLGDFVTENAGKPCNDPFAPLRAIRRSLIEDARMIFTDMHEMLKMGISLPNPGFLSREEIFAAHIEALENMQNFKKQLPKDKDTLEYLTDTLFPAYEGFLNRDSYIGQQLQREIVDVWQRLYAAHPSKPSAQVIALDAYRM